MVMGSFINSRAPVVKFAASVTDPYFVDKTEILNDIFPLLTSYDNSICVTRPRRFGKTG